MHEERDPLDELLETISRGVSVDWDAALQRVAGPARDQALHLREVDRIATFHRDLQGPAAGSDESLDHWGPLLILERIGSGSSADVYRAWDPGLRREVALKLMRRTGTEERAALLAEGRAAARIRHPNVVTVHGIDVHDDRVGLWMELIPGRRLGDLVEGTGPLAPAEALRLANELGAALAAVHAAGLLHRDLKPDNVVRDLDGRFVLTDFGLGLRRDAPPHPLEVTSGTPMYMAPELLQGGVPTQRTDLYGLGMVLRFAVTGRHPFDVATLPDLVRAASHGVADDLRRQRPDLSPAFARVLARAIAADPSDRLPSAAEFLGQVGSTSAATGRTRSRGLVLIVAVVTVAVVLGGQVQRHLDRARDPVGSQTYDVAARLVRHESGRSIDLVQGDTVRPGDLISFEIGLSRPSWVYVLNEDERGARFLLFPQPFLDRVNPLPASDSLELPGDLDATKSAWAVTSAGGTEHFLVVVSPEPVDALEAELDRIPAARPETPVEYASVSEGTVEQLRGVGGIRPLQGLDRVQAHSSLFSQFRPLAGHESGVRGVWVRHFVLHNPG